MKKRRILVIDDEKSIRETLSEILTDEGYAVTAVESGETGLRRLLEESFDLVFLDVWLRDRDGLLRVRIGCAAGPGVRIEGVAQRVAEQIERQDRYRHRQRRE